MQIRRAKSPSDFDAIVRIQCRCFWGGSLEIPEFTGAWWVAEDDGKVVGFCGIHPSNNWERCGYLCRAAVLPSHRGAGLQKRFIRVREQWARRQGWERIVTDTRAWNVASSNSLIACGYRLFVPAKNVAWVSDPDVLYWRKRL